MFLRYFLIKYNLILKLIELLTYFKFLYSKRYIDWMLEQEKIFLKFKQNKKKTIWIHCASLGEYEEIKAFIPEFKKINSTINITFFSLSGYLNFKDHHLINETSCLPLDNKVNMERYIQLMNPMMVIVAKNDIWPNMITYLNETGIPLYLIGFKLNTKKANNWFIKKYYESILSKFNFIFCEDNNSSNFLTKKNILNHTVIGNSRINQIIIDSKVKFENNLMHKFIANKKTIVYGSIEYGDYNKIINTINNSENLIHIIIPHEINNKTIRNLKNIIPHKITMYSQLKTSELNKSNILIVDVFGILKHIYKFSDIAYIGGGFNRGTHNTLEAAVHGNFMIFGPRHTNFSETIVFIEKNIATVIKNNLEFEKTINTFFNKNQSKKEILQITSSYFKENMVNLKLIINHIISLK